MTSRYVLFACSSNFDYLSSTFVDHFNSLPEMLNGEQTPRPLDADLYFDDQDSDQSNTCARLAVEFYGQQPVRALYYGGNKASEIL